MFQKNEKIPVFKWEVTGHCRYVEFLGGLEHPSARLVAAHGGETTLFFFDSPLCGRGQVPAHCLGPSLSLPAAENWGLVL